MVNLQKIKELLEDKKMSVRELAERVGLKENQVHVIVRSNSTKLETLEKIARVLGVKPGYFFDDSYSSEESDVAIRGSYNQLNGRGAHGNINGASPTEAGLLREIALLEARATQLEAQLADKERTIQLLLRSGR